MRQQIYVVVRHHMRGAQVKASRTGVAERYPDTSPPIMRPCSSNHSTAAAACARSDRWGCGSAPVCRAFAGISLSSSPHRRTARARMRVKPRAR
jgi:hypothetical protein